MTNPNKVIQTVSFIGQQNSIGDSFEKKKTFNVVPLIILSLCIKIKSSFLHRLTLSSDSQNQWFWSQQPQVVQHILATVLLKELPVSLQNVDIDSVLDGNVAPNGGHWCVPQFDERCAPSHHRNGFPFR